MPRRNEEIPLNLPIRAGLVRHEPWCRGDGPSPRDKDLAAAVGVSASTYSEFKKPRSARAPTLRHLTSLCRVFRAPPEAFYAPADDPFLVRGQHAAWRLSGDGGGAREHALRLAAVGVALGESPDEIGERIRRVRVNGWRDSPAPGEEEIRWMTRGALTLGLLEPVLAEPVLPDDDDDDPGLLDRSRSRRLSGALASHCDGRSPRVHVLHTPAHGDFPLDPTAPFLIARVAHRLVAGFLGAQRSATVLGVAAGAHVAAFVRSVGARSSPYPELPGSDRVFTLLPLTLEPMDDHKFELSDALVGELRARTAALLGPGRVHGKSFLAFGYQKDRTIEPLRPAAIYGVRQQYSDLDVAVMGCGDEQQRGWIEYELEQMGIRLADPPATDLCMNFLSREGEPIEILEEGSRREHLGLGLAQLQRLARSPHKMSLLLASGEPKGPPLVGAACSGAVDTIVCDARAADSALAALAAARPASPRRRTA
jgi:transcriptional regulator with XRE-family HTH domain